MPKSIDASMSTNRDWENTKLSLLPGTHVKVTVEQHCPFGVFARIPGVPFKGLIQITDFKDEGRMTPEEYPEIGEVVEVAVLGFMDHNQQIWLGNRPSQLAQREDKLDG